jgi:hypothetical protein
MLEKRQANSGYSTQNQATADGIGAPTIGACIVPLTGAVGSFVLAWTVVLCLVPYRNFSVWDDWAYAKGAMAFIAGDGIHYYGWASMPELGQWLWAWPFVKVLGPSLATLRIATIASAIVGLIAFYDLMLRHCPARPWLASFVTASLGFNPLFFWLSGTFMTDVPFLSFSLVALAYYERAWGNGGPLWLVPAAAFAALAAIMRQPGLAVPVAAGLVLVSRGGRAVVSWLAVIAPLACGLATLCWFNQRPDANPMTLHTLADTRSFVTEVLPLVGLELFVGVLILAASAIPLMVLAPVRSSWSALFLLVIALAAGALTLALKTGQWPASISGFPALVTALKTGQYFPYMGNTLADGFFVIGHDPEPMLIRRPVQFVLTAVACIAGAWLIASLARGLRAWRSFGRPLGLVAVFTVIQAIILPLAPRPYDRYYLPLLPGVLVFLAAIADPVRWRWKPALISVVLFGLVCVVTTRDWFTWTAATWKLGQRAMDERGIAAQDIEGGTAWDGWYSPTNAVRLTRETYQRKLEYQGFVIPFDHFLFPQLTGKYALSLKRWPKTNVVDAEPFRLWLFSEPREVHLIELPPSGTKK